MEQLQRLLLDKNLKPYFQKIKGRVLDTGGKHSPYKKFIRANKYEVLDIMSDHDPDYVTDVHDMKIIKNNTFDSILATELLEHCYNPQKVLDEFYRVLKKKGVVLLSVPFFFPFHPDPHDYYRYTEEGLFYLFRKFKKVKVIRFGSRAAFFWEMMTWVLPFMKIFNKLLVRFNFNDKNGPSGYIVFAEK